MNALVELGGYIFVGLLWGCTIPFIKRGKQRVEMEKEQKSLARSTELVSGKRLGPTKLIMSPYERQEFLGSVDSGQSARSRGSSVPPASNSPRPVQLAATTRASIAGGPPVKCNAFRDEGSLRHHDETYMMDDDMRKRRDDDGNTSDTDIGGEDDPLYGSSVFSPPAHHQSLVPTALESPVCNAALLIQHYNTYEDAKRASSPGGTVGSKEPSTESITPNNYSEDYRLKAVRHRSSHSYENVLTDFCVNTDPLVMATAAFSAIKVDQRTHPTATPESNWGDGKFPWIVLSAAFWGIAYIVTKVLQLIRFICSSVFRVGWGIFGEVAETLMKWHVLGPYLINQMGSVGFSFIVGQTSVSRAVPIANSLACVCTVATEFFVFKSWPGLNCMLGCFMILIGVSLCMSNNTHSLL